MGLPRSAEIKIEMRKARFSSRSEAGRYAAQQRWKGHTKDKPVKGSQSAPVAGRYKGDVTWGPYSGSQEAEQQFGDMWLRPKLFPDLVTGKSKNIPNLTLHGIKNDDGSFWSVFGIYQSPKGKTFRIVAEKGLVKAFVDGTKTRAGAITFYNMGDGTEIHQALVGAEFQRQGLGTAMLEAASSLYSDTISFSNALSDEGRAWMEATRNTTTKASFSSRSEAGRYAAQIRWQGHNKLDDGKVIGYNESGKGEPVKTDRTEIARALRKAGFVGERKVGRGFSSGFRTWVIGGGRIMLGHTISTGASSRYDRQITVEQLTKYVDALREAGFEIKPTDTDQMVEIVGKHPK